MFLSVFISLQFLALALHNQILICGIKLQIAPQGSGGGVWWW